MSFKIDISCTWLVIVILIKRLRLLHFDWLYFSIMTEDIHNIFFIKGHGKLFDEQICKLGTVCARSRSVSWDCPGSHALPLLFEVLIVRSYFKMVTRELFHEPLVPRFDQNCSSLLTIKINNCELVKRCLDHSACQYKILNDFINFSFWMGLLFSFLRLLLNFFPFTNLFSVGLIVMKDLVDFLD